MGALRNECFRVLVSKKQHMVLPALLVDGAEIQSENFQGMSLLGFGGGIL